MATWIEIRCEERGSAQPAYSELRCWSDDNGGPMGMAGDDNGSIADVMKSLRATAKKSGWKRTAAGWLCPGCITRKAAAAAAEKGGNRG